MISEIEIVERQTYSSLKPASRLRYNSFLAGGLFCVIASFSLYLLSLAPTVQAFDSAELTVGAYSLGFIHPPGYPLYLLLGHLFTHLPLLEAGYGLNLMTALLGVIAVLALYALLYLQLNQTGLALAGALFFATMPIFWSQAVRAEVYTLHNLLVLLALLSWYCARYRGVTRAYALCFALVGLGVANHSTISLLWAALGLAALIEDWRSWKRLTGYSLAGLMLGLGFYLYFPLRGNGPGQINYIQTYFGIDLSTWQGLNWLISFRAFQNFFYLELDWARFQPDLVRCWEYLCYNSLGIGLVLAGWGWRRLRKQHPAWNRLLTLYFAANLAAFFCYHVVDKEVMFIPLFAIMVIWMMHGAQALIKWLSRTLIQVSEKRIRQLVGVGLGLIIGLSIPLNWSAVSLRQDKEVYKYTAQVLNNVPPNTLILDHWITSAVFDYHRVVEQQRPDVKIFNLDFYFLGLQNKGISDPVQQKQVWLSWLAEKLEANQPLCFIEPLPPLPDGYRWANSGSCSVLVR